LAKILVTGAAGHAGRFVAPALLAAGHQVRGLFRTSPGDDPRVEWHQADLVKEQAYDSFLAGCDAVVHLAAELHATDLMDAVNVDATRRLALQAAQHGVRYFGYASSIVVYGSPRQRFVDESCPRLDPLIPIVRQYHAEPYMLQYARTKAAAEIALEQVDVPTIMDFYRPAVIVEPSDMLRAGDWSLPRKIFAGYRNTQFVTATDAAAAIVHLVQRGLDASKQRHSRVEAYNIADQTVLTFSSLFRRAYRATGNPKFNVAFDVPVIMDIAKDFAYYRNRALRYPLGMLTISPAKLLATGFVVPLGVERALSDVIADLASRRSGSKPSGI
jgi:nucleoside-diphosphate-sugar epimerase